MRACTNDKKKCVKLYKSNLKVAQSFHPLLCSLEVVLRNCINNQLSLYFNDPDWIINQKTGFIVDSLLKHKYKRTSKVESYRFIFNSIIEAEEKLRKKGFGITSGRVISEQPFGFWTSLFENHYYRILKGRPIRIFKNLPSGYGRSEVVKELSKIRQFRNRINHNEPICFVGGEIDFSYTVSVYHSVLNLFSWIDPKLNQWIKDIDMVNETIEEIKNI